MLRLQGANVAAAVVGAACAFAVPVVANATDYRPIQLVQGTPAADAGSRIELTSIVLLRFLPRQFDGNDPDSWQEVDVECVQFVNRDARIAKHVRVRFSYRTRDGKELRSDILDVDGSFLTGVTIGQVPPDRPVMRGQPCRQVWGFNWGVENVHYVDYASGGRYEHVSLNAAIDEVAYTDGTLWRAPG
ncbi:MAG TPA: hypothetical protein VGC72_00870 [Candidatus Elarobacter sp.]|jgi:hypothetical protein